MRWISRKKNTVSPESILTFWSWFQENAEAIEGQLDAGNVKSLDASFTPRIKALHPDLSWEVGPGRVKSNMLAISAKSNWKLRPETDRIVAAAPSMERWEFYPSIPPREAPPTIVLGESTRVKTANWRFLPEYDDTQGKVHITIVDSELAALKRETALHAIFVYLDSALGEDAVETQVGCIDIKSGQPHLGPLYPICDLPGYLAKKLI